MGSSPMSIAVVSSSANAYPLVFRLYPRLKVATLKLLFKCKIRNSTIGDLPVPPTERLPTQISGIPKEADLRILLSYSQLRIDMITQNKIANGNNKTRKDFRNQLENICPFR